MFRSELVNAYQGKPISASDREYKVEASFEVLAQFIPLDFDTRYFSGGENETPPDSLNVEPI